MKNKITKVHEDFINLMNDAGVTIGELNTILNNDFIMTDRTRDILIEYSNFLTNKQ